MRNVEFKEMKMKQKLMILTAVLGLLAFSRCTNPLGPPPKTEGNDIAPGKGIVRVDTGTGAARTVIPAAVFDHYEYWFSPNGAAAVKTEPVDGVFELEAGENWTVTVKAFVEAEEDSLAAEGTSAAFSVTAGADTGVIPVTLYPVVSEGAGTLTYSLMYPAGTTVQSFTLTLLAGESSIDLKTTGTAGGIDPITYSGQKTAIPSGYYLARGVLKKDGITSGKSEVVHIYKNMSSSLSWTFTGDDFTAIRVYSSTNSGAGSLRQALIDAAAGNTIVIDLPEGDRVISLTSRLPAINKNLTIEGNGATLLGNSYTQIMYISGGEVTIRRLHFKDGTADSNGGAIYKTGGSLSLESCIFSGNRTTGTYAYGGAIYNSGTLNVLGCTFYGNTTSYRGGAIYNQSSTLSLWGNLFYGNIAANNGNVVYRYGGTVSSGGYNASDKAGGTNSTTGSGWTFVAGDIQSVGIPITPVSFKPLPSSAVIDAVTAKPTGYPEYDFYGTAIGPVFLAAGAVQIPAAAGYVLVYDVVNGAVNIVAGSDLPDADGIYSPGNTITLEAVPDSGSTFSHWTVNGVRQGPQNPTNRISLTVNANKTVRAICVRNVTVSNVEDSGQGSLRAALSNALDYDLITIDPSLTGQAISLVTRLPEINKIITIEGNGVTLLGSGIPTDSYSQIMSVIGGEVTIRRLHFKDGTTTNQGGAIYKSGGILNLESCIFSGNRTTASDAWGGALYNSGTLSIMGCTFYGNTSPYYGGAIYNSGTLTLTGNLFYGNTAPYGNVVYNHGTVSSGGYNVSDKANGTNSTTGSGWTFAIGDVQSVGIPITPVSFKPLPGSVVISAVMAKPAGYSEYDFYGTAMGSAPMAAGAVQSIAAGYYLDYGVVNGTVSIVAGSALPDADGIYGSGGSVTLEAAPDNGCIFYYWTINGVKQAAQNPADRISLTINTNKTVRAVCVRSVTVSSAADSGQGSLRAALSNALDYDLITLDPILTGQTISLVTRLPEINKIITIEGNGVTLLGSGITAGNSSQIVYITGGEASIRRLHFKGGTATDDGGAIFKDGGTLNLESCIFSGNRTISYGGGGAVYNYSGTLNISGCTFYGNTAVNSGGAIAHSSGTLTLTGNLFYDNTASSGHNVVYNNTGTVNSGGYNVSDKANGIHITNGSGWTFVTGDTQSFNIPITPVSFKPLQGSVAIDTIPARPAGYPEYDFYGDPIPVLNAAAGAVQTVAPAYDITLSPSGHTFPAAMVGYGARTAKTVTISNSGNQPTGNLTIALSGANSSSFSLNNKTTINDIAVNGSDSFTVVPNTGLPVGTYIALVTVSGDNGITASFTVSFIVNPAVGLTITAWVNEDGTLIADSPAVTTISKAAGAALTVQAAAELTDIQWSLNGVAISAPRGTAQSITFAASNYPAGTYVLGLRVIKNGVPYSTDLDFRVTN
jgi:hypothetical protein